MITHVYTIVTAATGEIVRYVLAPADYIAHTAPGETVCAQTLAAYFGAPVEVIEGSDLAERLLAVLEKHGPAVIEGLPQLKLVVARPTAGEELAAAFWAREPGEFGDF